MRIGLYANPDKDTGFITACRVAALIAAGGAISVVGEQYLDTAIAKAPGVVVDSYASCDLLLSLGGDGTFLSAVHLPGCEHVPIAGINLGSVGFLPEVLPEHLDQAISKLLLQHYRIEERMLLDVRCYDPDNHLLERGFALNDAVISRGGKSRILMLDLKINHEMVERIPGDGLIISTPTGSTGYSLSASGPIVHPDLALMLITPICPHTLHNRSYVTPADSAVIVRICEYPYYAVLAIDGRQEIDLASGCSVIVKQAKHNLQMIRLGDDRFYATLPQKIQARGKVN